MARSNAASSLSLRTTVRRCRCSAEFRVRAGRCACWSVKYLPQNQPMRRSRHARDAAVFFCEHGFDAGAGKLSQADLHEGSDDPTAHLVEKTFTLDNEREAGAASFEVATDQCAHSGLPGITGI